MSLQKIAFFGHELFTKLVCICVKMDTYLFVRFIYMRILFYNNFDYYYLF